MALPRHRSFHIFPFLLLFWALPLLASAQSGVDGYVADSKGQPMAYASVYIKGTTTGTTTNAEGRYQLELAPGTYTLYCAHIGYVRAERTLQVRPGTWTKADFALEQQVVELNEVVIKAGAEDPAYEIIRKAISKRKEYLNEAPHVQSMVYMKGLIRSLAIPNAVLGRKVTVNNDVIDSSGKGILYFSESVTQYSKRPGGQYREEVVSARLSGNSQGFGFNSPNTLDLNFYDNNIALPGINNRGFVSPIHDNAFNFYRYKYEGSFYEGGQEINKIRVMPKRDYEPTFAGGHIQIIEGSWRIHSLSLYLNKRSQMEVVDTLTITQEMIPAGQGAWLPQYTRIEAGFGILGFKMAAEFAAVFSDYNLQPLPEKFWKSNIIKSIDTSANKRTIEFWDSLRPMPLTDEERLDYVRKDSLEQKFRDPAYQDSLTRIANKFSPMGLLLTGQQIRNRRQRTTIELPALLNSIQYNTVEQWVINLEGSFTKRQDTGRYSIVPRLRYSTAHNRLHMDVTYNKRIGKAYNKRWDLALSGGRNIFQLNPSNPILPLNNTLGTLLYSVNFMKVYEKAYAGATARRTIGRGLQLTLSASYEDRRPLENTDTVYRWRRFKDRSFTSNYPEELPSGFFDKHQAFLTTASLRYQPGVKYIQYPNRRVSVPSEAPVFFLSLTRAWAGVGNADADFGKWYLRMRDEVNLKLGGEIKYELATGGFISNRKVRLPDWQHFMGNQTIVASPYVRSFQLAPYYAYSTNDRFFSTAHVEWHLNGLLTNKIPLMKKANWNLVTGGNAFYVGQNRNYSEVFVGVSNILKVFRVDYVWGWDGNTRRWVNGLVIGAGGLLSGLVAD